MLYLFKNIFSNNFCISKNLNVIIYELIVVIKINIIGEYHELFIEI